MGAAVKAGQSAPWNGPVWSGRIVVGDDNALQAWFYLDGLAFKRCLDAEWRMLLKMGRGLASLCGGAT